jgi:hypothetical protein
MRRRAGRAENSAEAWASPCFSRADEITLEDKRIEFTAMFGRLFIAQFFYTGEMQFQGMLEL